ncbi:MAG: DUF3422 domain-containing protein [Rhodospirillales bacterium]|nr:DUF3422 domain-containing protein [Rhodospirillales bacterium]
MTLFPEHPQRRGLVDEIHARPYLLLRAPARLSHLAVLTGEGRQAAERAHLAQLCQAFNVAPPPADAALFSARLGTLLFRWEQHTEFSTYTFAADGAFDQPFKEPPAMRLPADWVRAIPGETISAVHIAIEPASTPDRAVEKTAALFDNNTVIGSAVHDGQARVWTDARVHADGYGRFLVKDLGLNQRQLGRLAQRLVEINAYYLLAMLAYPLARAALPKIVTLEQELSESVRMLSEISGLGDENALLKRLSTLAAETEAVAATTNYRFSAARAYFALVCQRFEDLRGTRLEWMQPLDEFLLRRLAPAMETCNNVHARQESLSVRIARASDLLRTRVDVAHEAQNRDLLRSMNRRAKTQLRLQQTVEGLSVAAISYYLVGLVAYAAKAAHGVGVKVDPDLAAGLAIPVVLALVWFAVRRLRRAVVGRAGEDDA